MRQKIEEIAELSAEAMETEVIDSLEKQYDVINSIATEDTVVVNDAEESDQNGDINAEEMSSGAEANAVTVDEEIVEVENGVKDEVSVAGELEDVATNGDVEVEQSASAMDIENGESQEVVAETEKEASTRKRRISEDEKQNNDTAVVANESEQEIAEKKPKFDEIDVALENVEETPTDHLENGTASNGTPDSQEVLDVAQAETETPKQSEGPSVIQQKDDDEYFKSFQRDGKKDGKADPSPKAHKLFRDAEFSELNETWDTADYRRDYTNHSDRPSLNDNLKFLTGEMKSKPNGDFVDEILRSWCGNYNLLEDHHGYIQWLFPIRTKGMNFESQPLQIHELKALKKDEKVLERLRKAYEMMLDFYGMKIADKVTGKLERSEKYEDRYKNLRKRSHNYLRITRILKCLGDFDMEEHQIAFLQFLLQEIFETQELKSLRKSYCSFWVHTIKNDRKRDLLLENVKKAITQVN